MGTFLCWRCCPSDSRLCSELWIIDDSLHSWWCPARSCELEHVRATTSHVHQAACATKSTYTARQCNTVWKSGTRPQQPMERSTSDFPLRPGGVVGAENGPGVIPGLRDDRACFVQVGFGEMASPEHILGQLVRGLSLDDPCDVHGEVLGLWEHELPHLRGDIARAHVHDDLHMVFALVPRGLELVADDGRPIGNALLEGLRPVHHDRDELEPGAALRRGHLAESIPKLLEGFVVAPPHAAIVAHEVDILVGRE
mmetsp:Transcript_28797/g.77508  ORF Transcript_28797/g.77508 Transcript_28797/m.77508 type:complete len:254 (-) Transcript_28797:768-1529(-)